jgi:glycosyltransferase involved in cell wall biosynthesis
MRILQVDSVYRQGGAGSVVYNLARKYRERGHQSWQVAGHAPAPDADVIPMPKARGLLQRLRDAVLPAHAGAEDIDYPQTRRLLELTPQPPSVVHCHNLHGGYFDLRELPRLSSRLPTFLTLHDAWLLSGHCAHSFSCERWRTGCGQCPDLSIPPAIPVDRTAENWRLKASIYGRSRLHVATPSQWLMDRVEKSMLAAGVAEARVIPNGVDLAIFRPAADRAALRAALGFAPDDFVLVFSAHGIRDNVWKDIATLRAALGHAAQKWPAAQRLRLVAVGESAPPETIGRATVEFVPYVREASRLADHYRAADVYVHAAKVDTFPNTVLEALACGVPVVATAVGGIPEQVRPLDAAAATGILVPPGDAAALGDALYRLGQDPALLRTLSSNARRDVEQRFDLETQVDRYLGWYAERAGKAQ